MIERKIYQMFGYIGTFVIGRTFWGVIMTTKAIARGVVAGGADVRVCSLYDVRYEETHRSDAATEVLDSRAIPVWPPTPRDWGIPMAAGSSVTAAGFSRTVPEDLPWGQPGSRLPTVDSRLTIPGVARLAWPCDLGRRAARETVSGDARPIHPYKR
jgi:hypothetical protein